MKDEMFIIRDHWERGDTFYIKTDYGELSTTDELQYESAVNDGFIIIKVYDYPSDSI